MFANTITITRDGTAVVLSRIRDDGYSSEYFFRDAVAEHRLTFRHSLDKADAKGVVMERHYVAYQRNTIVVAPAIPQKEVCSTTVLTQKGGDPVACQKTAMAAIAWLTSANVTSLIAWES